MSEENKHIDKLFKSALDAHQKDVPASSWDALSKDLDNAKIEVLNPKSKRRRYLLPLLFLLLLLGGYFYFSGDSIVKKEDITISKLKSPIQESNNSLIPNDDERVIATSKSIKEKESKGSGISDNGSITKKKQLVDNTNTTNKTNTLKLNKSKTKSTSVINLDKKANSKINDNNSSVSLSKNKKAINLKPNLFKSSKKQKIHITAIPDTNKSTKSNQDIAGGEIKNLRAINDHSRNKSIFLKDSFQIPQDTVVQYSTSNKPKEFVVHLDTIGSTAKEIILDDKPFNNLNATIDTTLISNVVLEDDKKVDESGQKSDTLVLLKKKRHFSLELFAAPLYTVNFMKDDSPNNQIDDPIAYKSREKSKYSFSAGVALRYHLNDKFSFSLGANYSSIAYSVEVNRIYASLGTDDKPHFKYLTSWGTIQMPYFYPGQVINLGDSLDFNTTCEQLVKFINIPLIARYHFSNSRFSWFIDAGFSVNFKTNEQAVIKVDNDEYKYENERVGIKSMNYYAIFGIGGNYNFTNKLSFFFEPIFRGSISSITENIPVKTYPHSYGLNIGLSFHFN